MAEIITRQSAADAFNSNVRNRVSWSYSYSNPPQPWGGYSSGVNRSNFGSNPGYMSAGNITGGIITASTFANNVRQWIASNLSQVRYIRIIHRNTGDNSNINGDSTYVAVCSGRYIQGISLTQSDMDISKGEIISKNGINWNNAYDAWYRVRNNVAFTITNTIHVQHVQHTSHSDHGNRVRR